MTGDRTRIRRRGLMLVLSSPSGAGKSTIARNLLESDPGWPKYARIVEEFLA